MAEPSKEAVRAAAEVLAPAINHSRRGWDHQPEEVRRRAIEAVEPLAREVLRAAEGL